MRETQYYIGAQREDQGRKVLLSLITVSQDAQKGAVICFPRHSALGT